MVIETVKDEIQLEKITILTLIYLMIFLMNIMIFSRLWWKNDSLPNRKAD